MGIIDTIIILLFIVFMIVGFFKGFLKQVFSTFGWIIALVAATLLSKPVGNYLFGTNIGIGINGFIYNWMSNKGELFTTPIPQLTTEYLNSALSDLGIPSFLHDFVNKMIDVSAFQDMSLAEIVSPKLASFFLVAISYIVIYLVIFLISKLLACIAKKIVRGSALGFIDGLLGAALSAVKVAIFISLAMLLLSFITTTPFGEPVLNWINNDMKLLEEEFGIARYFYEYNPIYYIIDYFHK